MQNSVSYAYQFFLFAIVTFIQIAKFIRDYRVCIAGFHFYFCLKLGHIRELAKGPSINDVTPEGEGGG